MRVSLLLLVATLSALLVLTEAGKSDNEMAENYCTKVGYSYKSGIWRSQETLEANGRFERCKSDFLKYIKSFGMPSEADINHFLEVCTKKIQIVMAPCSNLMFDLSKYGYTFSAAAALANDLSKKQFKHLFEGHDRIALRYSMRQKLVVIDNLNIDQCIFDFWSDPERKESIMTTYLNWWQTENGMKTTYCNCDHVFGLRSIYDASKLKAGILASNTWHNRTTGKETDIRVLYDYFKNVCSENFSGIEKWNQVNLKCIGESKLPLNGVDIKQFLSTCFSFVEARWCHNGSAILPFDYLWPKVKSASSEEIKIISYAVSANFNGDHHNRMVQIMTTYGENFVSKKCLDDMIEAAFKRDDFSNGKNLIRRYLVWDYSTTVYEKRLSAKLPYEYWDHPFNNHIQILMELYLKTSGTSGKCEEFVEYLSKFKSLIVQRYFSEKSLTKNLTELVKKRTNFDDLIQCYRFTLDFEEKIYYTYFMLKNPDPDKLEEDYNFFGYKVALIEFRRLLFEKLPLELKEICRNQHPQQNINSKDGIWKLMKSLFKNIDYDEGEHLNYLFEKVTFEVERVTRASITQIPIEYLV